MTAKQRRLIYKSVAFVVALALVIGFFPWAVEHSWVRWPLLAAIVIAAAFEKRPRNPPDIEGWVTAHPWVKVWLAICGLVIAALAYTTTHSSLRLEEMLGERSVMLLLLVTLGPLGAVGVWETYKSYGEENNAT